MRGVFLVFCLLLPPLRLSIEAKPVRLPASCRRLLHKRFPGWEYAKAAKEVDEYLRERVSPDARSEIIGGDWDGDGRPDYAVLIRHTEIFKARGEAIGSNLHLIAFLNREGGYRYHVLEAVGEYLDLIKKGERGFDFETQRYFRYRNDAIFAGIFEKAGTSFVYERKRFRQVLTSD